MINVSKEWLYDQYIVQNKTVRQIADKCGYSKDTLAHKLSDYGIKNTLIKPYQEYEWLYNEYIVKGRTTKDIAKQFSVRQETIVRNCNNFGILRKAEPVFTNEFLYNEHIIKHKSMLQIAKETNRNNTTVRKYMDLYNIPVWTCHDNTNEYIDRNDGITDVKVFDAYGKYINTFTIDTSEIDKVKKYKWIIVEDNIVNGRTKYRVVTGKHPTIILGRYLLNIEDKDIIVDHTDNNPLNNCLSNLRRATRSQNQMNHGLQTNNTSGFTGVVKNKNKWHVQLRNKTKNYHFGNYKNLCDAVYARYIAECEIFGEFRNTQNDEEIFEQINLCNSKESIRRFVIELINSHK